MRVIPEMLVDRRLRKSPFEGYVEIYLFQGAYSENDAVSYLYEKDGKHLQTDTHI